MSDQLADLLLPTRLEAKDPGDERDYSVTYAGYLSGEGDDAVLLEDVEWSATPAGAGHLELMGGGTFDDAGIATVRVKGGLAGQEYTLSALVTLTDGQKFVRRYVILCHLR